MTAVCCLGYNWSRPMIGPTRARPWSEDDRVAVPEVWCHADAQALADGPRAQICGERAWDGGSGRVHCGSRARMGPEAFPSGHPLRGPCDDALIRLGPLLRHASSVQLPPEPALGLGSGEDDRVEIIEGALRSLAYVQEPAPSGKVDLVQEVS